MTKTAISFLLLPEFGTQYIKARVFARVVGAGRPLGIDSVSSEIGLHQLTHRTKAKSII
jgi:uncharacterized membrane protein (DUF485 family)